MAAFHPSSLIVRKRIDWRISMAKVMIVAFPHQRYCLVDGCSILDTVLLLWVKKLRHHLSIFICNRSGHPNKCCLSIVSLIDVAEDVPVSLEVEADAHSFTAGESWVHCVREVSREEDQIPRSRGQPQRLAERRKRSSRVEELDIWMPFNSENCLEWG